MNEKEKREYIDRLIELSSWLAKLSMENYDAGLKMCSANTIEEARDIFMKDFSIVQGTANQHLLRKLGNMPANTHKLLDTISYIINNSFPSK